MEATRKLEDELAKAYDRREITPTDFMLLSRDLRAGYDESFLRSKLHMARRDRKGRV